ncbi:snRNA-activating protein complex subunit 4 [Escovopsis weberi]|uniref:snRNA-activating protein complex subunit 4 n=1 Tax=Escovopsis weberi TaxID=150374 RepID=A0A0M8N0A3_ESCWE|nr:snRNA-activating protein complex subunit 4 [Escovopsis weberi]
MVSAVSQTLMPNISRRSMTPHVQDPPVKKQSKWSPEEDALIIELRGSGMKWEDVSKKLPGRSAISCRLHYQNYLERRSEWDEERKNKLARLYERFKADMWAKVAEELQVPWRAAEAMHWQLGETDMARRAGVVPFSLAAVNVEASNRNLAQRSHTQSQTQHGSPLRDTRPTSPRSVYGRGQPLSLTPGRGSRRHQGNTHSTSTSPTSTSSSVALSSSMTASVSAPPSSQSSLQASVTLQHPHAQQHSHSSHSSHAPPPPQQPVQAPMSHPGPPHPDFRHSPGPGLAPIQNQPSSRLPGPLPSVAQLTTGMGHFDTSSGPPTPGHMPPRFTTLEPTGSKRRASPEMSHREGGLKRRM